jgi:BirA family transcriptional regulator, biotin operon repressor / biotin---[acetyl-CoA-carboxylase] ligase
VNEAPLTEEAVGSALRTRRVGCVVYALERIDSTNAFAKTLAGRGAPDGTLVVSDHQTAGRGRWGRTWASAPGLGLQFSLLIRPGPGTLDMRRLTLTSATSVAQAAGRLGLQARLRWPNDVTAAGKKIAGVIVETQRNRKGASFAVIGVGVNLNQRRSDFPEALVAKAGSIRQALGRKIDRLAFLADLLLQMERDIHRLETEGPDFAFSRWVRRNALLGKPVTLLTAAGEQRGVVKGFHSDGALILAGADGRLRRFSDAEVTEVSDAAGY